ncbi:MAG TPA: acyl-[ACP]--phospholipid O-acyltransferase [Bryobacterales bacterium]|nr:acyl-[ACP]--phospholipid O-acyltransferase [Bryobacterales bacterium]
MLFLLPEMPGSNYKSLLKSAGFEAFLWTQFLGAFNDNAYKCVVSLLAVEMAAAPAGGQSAAGNRYLSEVLAVFILPFLLFSGYAGRLADVRSKRGVLIVTKAFEIVAMTVAFFAFFTQRLDLMLGVVFLTSTQAAFFSPAKYGILPEMLPDKDLSRANGLLELSTFVAIVAGTALGGLMLQAWRDGTYKVGIVLLAIAVAGTATSFGISRVPASGSQQPFRWNPLAEVLIGIRRLYRDKPLWLTVVGISYFWFLGALVQTELILFGTQVLRADERSTALLAAFLAIGIGAGSIVAGRLSGDKVELGLVPLGSIGMGVFGLWLAAAPPSYPAAAAALVLLGLSGGLFIVPLNAFLQQRSGDEEKGRLIATNNFLNMAGVLLASGVLWLFGDRLGIAADRIFLIFGIFTLLATVYILTILPDFLIRFSLWMLTHTIYRIRIVGAENVPVRGPALLVSNHISMVDGLIVGACVQRFIRFLVYRPYYELKLFHWLLRLMKAIPVEAGSRREVVESLARARREIEAGHVVCIFAEGSVSRTGKLLPFKRGFERIVEGLEAPVIPVHLDRLWGSIFSFKNGRFFWKWPERIPYPVTVSFGLPLPAATTAQQVRQAVQEMGSAAAGYRPSPRDLLHLRFLKTAKRRRFAFCMADSAGKRLNYGRTLAASLLLSRWVRRQCRGDLMVGLLLPASIGGALANIAALFAGKVPVNLNFTAGLEAMASAISQCQIRTILTSKTFLAKAKLEPVEGMVFLEDILSQTAASAKARAALAAFLLPARLLALLYCPQRPKPDALATVVFSSGSTGVPKGVMLSHHNIVSNIEALAQVFWVTRDDCVMGVLPFFHSFGFTATLWFPLVAGFGVAYHPNPVDAKTIGEMVERYRATILISTPTFYAGYLRKCPAEQFRSLRYALVGAEKLREPLAGAFRSQYGLELLEGYGATEMAPVISVNTPDVEQGSERQKGFKPGSVGHPIPGVTAKVVDPSTHEALPANTPGLLLVKGPNRMLGYLGQPDKTAEVFDDGWYVTGDIASIDDDGFLTITDRLSRFSKIGGEMVPHIRVEEALSRILGDGQCVVTGLPDEQRGERLVVLYASPHVSPGEVWEQLSRSDLPKLWIPKRDSFYRVESIPILGTGKLDLQRVKKMAAEIAGTADERR